MKILTKYVLREHVGPFVFAATALTSLMLLQFIGKRLGDLVGKGLPAHALVEFFVLSMPLTIALTLPMAVLVAVLYAYSRLASENEVTALRANGVSMTTLMVPTLLAGAVVALVMLVFNDQVLSRANHQLAVLQTDISRTKPSLALKEQVINTVVDQKFYLRAAHIDRASQRMTGVVIYDLSDPAHRRTIYADSGTLGLAENHVDLVMHLFDGSMVEVPNDHPEQFTRLFYKRDLLRVRDVTNSFQASDADSATKSDREMTVCEMQAKYASVDFAWQQADYQRRYAVAALLQAHGEQHIQWPVKPQPRNPAGLGKIYCGLVGWIFGVKSADAATLQTGGAAQHPDTGHAQTPVRAPAPAVAAPSPQAISEAQAAAARIRLQNEQETSLAREKLARFQRIRYDIEIQKKFSLAATCLIFVLLGPPIALRFPRGGVGLVIGVSFVIFTLSYVGLSAGEPLANSEIISPFWAMWGANLLLLVIGIVMTLRMNRLGGGMRGGDWSEVREGIKQLAARLTGRRQGAA